MFLELVKGGQGFWHGERWGDGVSEWWDGPCGGRAGANDEETAIHSRAIAFDRSSFAFDEGAKPADRQEISIDSLEVVIDGPGSAILVRSGASVEVMQALLPARLPDTRADCGQIKTAHGRHGMHGTVTFRFTKR
jgi:hypothetical protein